MQLKNMIIRAVGAIILAMGIASLSIIIAITQACSIIESGGSVTNEYFDFIVNNQMNIPILLAIICMLFGIGLIAAPIFIKDHPVT